MGYPLPSQLGGLGSVVNSSSEVAEKKLDVNNNKMDK